MTEPYTGHRNGNPKLNWEQVGEIRKHYLKHPATRLKYYCAIYGVSNHMIWMIVNNLAWKRDDYMPPPKSRGARRAAYEFVFHCPICGMGSDETQEANDCCKRLEEHVYVDRPAAPKYGATKGETTGKYDQHHDWANRGNW